MSLAEQPVTRTPRDLTRAQWLSIYRGMRCVRSRALQWLDRAAKTPAGMVASPRTLGHRLLTMTYQDEDMRVTTEIMRKHDCARMAIIRVGATDSDFDDRKVYALHVLPESVADSPTIAWALACLATYVIDERSSAQRLPPDWHRIDKRRSRSFVRNAAGLYNAFRDQAERMLHRFIADAISGQWERACDGNEFARDLLRERLVVFKKRRARAERGSDVVAIARKDQAA